MKKLLLLLQACCMILLVSSTALAAENTANTNPHNWEISMMPKPTAEEIEAARWSLVVENDIGVYAYDMDSLEFAVKKNDEQDKNMVKVLVKTVFTNKDVLKKLQKDYADKLEGKEKVLYCKMDMQFNLKDKTYNVKQMNVYTNKDRQIDIKRNRGKFVPVPEKTFAEAMLEICQQYAADTQKAAEASAGK